MPSSKEKYGSSGEEEEEREVEQRDGDSSDDEDDRPLFTYKSRGAFKRKARSDNESDADGSHKSRKDSDDSDSDSDGDDAFNSSPDNSGRSGGLLADPGERKTGRMDKSATGAGDDLSDIVIQSDDDDDGQPPPPKRRIVLDEAELNARARQEAEELAASAARASSSACDKQQRANQQARARLLAAARVEPTTTTTTTSTPARYGGPATTASGGAGSSARAWRNEWERERTAKRDVRLTVSRGRRHKFRTKLGTTVEDVLESCRKEFLTVEEQEQETELCLYHGTPSYHDFVQSQLLDEGSTTQMLDETKSLMDAGITKDADLRLEVAGVSCPSFSGPPITLKLRVEVKEFAVKEFTVETTQDTKFSAFIESFCAAVGVPEARAKETAFFFDGDKLRPDGTPKGEDMDEEDLVDVTIPTDLMPAVQAAPKNLKLLARPKTNKVPSTPKRKRGVFGTHPIGKGKGSTTMEESALSAEALCPSRRSTRSTRGQASRLVNAAMAGDDVVVLSD